MKKLAFLFIVIGITFLSIGSYQYFRIQAAERGSLEEAHQILDAASQRNSETNKVHFNPEHGDTVGLIEIESIEASLPIIEGTDPDDLDRGVGHLTSSAYPGENDQILLSGHRDTVFSRLGEVEIGDKIVIKLPYGEFTYEMVDSTIVDADDRTIIKSTAPNEELVLTTCYPFSYIGDAPERYILYAVPVEEEA